MRYNLSMLAVTVCCLIILFAGCSSSVRLMNAPSVPAAMGDVKLSNNDDNNTTVTIKVQHLTHPEKLTPPKSVYVVWVEAGNEKPVNLGQLMVDDNLNGEFSGTTPSRYFRIVITAENSATVTEPGYDVVLSTDQMKP